MIDYSELIIRLRSAQRRADALAYGIFGAKRSPLYDQAANAIEELQAQMPKRGEWKMWEDYDYHDVYTCSVCGADWDMIDGTPQDNDMNYCPHCGAKMEVGE